MCVQTAVRLPPRTPPRPAPPRRPARTTVQSASSLSSCDVTRCWQNARRDRAHWSRIPRSECVSRRLVPKPRTAKRWAGSRAASRPRRDGDSRSRRSMDVIACADFAVLCVSVAAERTTLLCRLQPRPSPTSALRTPHQRASHNAARRCGRASPRCSCCARSLRRLHTASQHSHSAIRTQRQHHRLEAARCSTRSQPLTLRARNALHQRHHRTGPSLSARIAADKSTSSLRQRAVHGRRERKAECCSGPRERSIESRQQSSAHIHAHGCNTACRMDWRFARGGDAFCDARSLPRKGRSIDAGNGWRRQRRPHRCGQGG